MKHTITILFLLVFIAVSDMTAQSLYSERYTQSISRTLLCNRAVSNPAEHQVGPTGGAAQSKRILVEN